MNNIIRERIWRWFGHVCKRPQEYLTRLALRRDPSWTKKQRTAKKKDPEEDDGEGPERKVSLLRNATPNSSGPTENQSSSTASSARRLRED
ncbi:hypothetical protein ElyMa_006418000 [Elysia marginata]|uniref:Uncharacterized protein n=1 Tax=Elysia marginata TaxID=1093978 RepID=A0AAV4HSX5_9GAST|nr:hypothetical protein ElyMa_006418000 [Elysia marginata]